MVIRAQPERDTFLTLITIIIVIYPPRFIIPEKIIFVINITIIIIKLPLIMVIGYFLRHWALSITK